MSTNTQNNENQEIDLSQISKKIGGFFTGITDSFFRIIHFFSRNKKTTIALLITGVGLGYYLDKTSSSYNHEIIVTPNFGSNDYLYSKVDLIDSKIKNRDTIFLKEVVGIKKASKLKIIEIAPIADVYKFIEDKQQNFELLKLMAEDGDIKKVVSENLTSKNYPFHRITFSTSDQTNYEATIKPLLNYFNQSEYYAKIQKQHLENIRIKMAANDSIIKQIDGFLNTFSKSVNTAPKNDKLIFYNENTQLNDVIKTKDAMNFEQGSNRMSLVNLDNIVKENSTSINNKDTSGINGKMKYVLPILFVLLFGLTYRTRLFIKKGISKVNN